MPDTPVPDASAAESRPARQRAQFEHLALVGLSAVALLLRFHALDRQSIWYDEANSIRIAARPPAELFTELSADASPPLYYLAMHLWIAVLGTHEFAVRAFSALAGAAAVPLLFLTGRRFFGRRAAWTAAGLAAISPFHLYYSQEARMYSLLALVATLVLLLGYRAGRRDHCRDWIGFALACAAGAYVHNYGLFIAAGVVGALALLLRHHRGRLLHLGWACATAALLYLPWLPHAIRSQLQGTAITGGWLPSFGLHLISQTVSHLCSLHMFTPRALLFWVGYAAVALALAGLTVRRLRTPAGEWRWRWRLPPSAGFPAVAFLIALALPVAISAAKPIYLPERYAIAFWPAAVLLLAAGLSRLPEAWFRASVAALVLTSGAGLIWHFGYMQKSGDRKAAIFLAEHLRDTDLVVFAPHWTAVAPLYYLRALPHQTGYPMRTLEERRRHNEALERDRRSLADMTRLLDAHGRQPGARIVLVRLLAEWETDAAQLQQAIERGWTRAAAAAFPPLAVIVYEPGPAVREGTP